MNFFKKLFGRKSPKQAPSEKEGAACSPNSDPSQDPNMIRVFDGYGRELFISKQDWREQVLPGNLKSAWNNPDELYGVILTALGDGFRSDVVQAAEHLHRIDPNRERGTCVWGIILSEEERLDQAEKVFRQYLTQHGESGVILTNLAKVYARRKQEAKAEEILWHALEVDPNQENGMGWYEVIHRERGGNASSIAALKRVAALPGSWRAQLWLAREALQNRQLDQAIALYKESISRAGDPLPTDLLRQMSGDLGNAGHLLELLDLTLPHFQISLHGLDVGNNLIKAHFDLGQLDSARHLLDGLYALKRPDWKPTLQFWDTEIAKARVSITSFAPENPPKVSMLTIEGPVWLKPSSPAAELFPAREEQGLAIAFLGSTASYQSDVPAMHSQLSDAPGRLSRALPLYLAEQTAFRSNASVKALFPWVSEENAGFVLATIPWTEEAAANYARGSEQKSDYVVITHLKAAAEPWEIELRLVRTIDSKGLGSLCLSVNPNQMEDSLRKLADQLLALLATQAEVGSLPPPPEYHVPSGSHFDYYLLRLEQLLAVRSAGMQGINPGFLSGEREIIDGNIQLCVDHPSLIPVRILLSQTLLAMHRARPDIIPEFKEKISLLGKEKPLPEPANSVVQGLLNACFPEASKPQEDSTR